MYFQSKYRKNSRELLDLWDFFKEDDPGTFLLRCEAWNSQEALNFPLSSWRMSSSHTSVKLQGLVSVQQAPFGSAPRNLVLEGSALLTCLCVAFFYCTKQTAPEAGSSCLESAFLHCQWPLTQSFFLLAAQDRKNLAMACRGTQSLLYHRVRRGSVILSVDDTDFIFERIRDSFLFVCFVVVFLDPSEWPGTTS